MCQWHLYGTGYVTYKLLRNPEGTTPADIYLPSVQEHRTSHHLVKEEVASSELETAESSARKDTAVDCGMLPPVNRAGLERM